MGYAAVLQQFFVMTHFKVEKAHFQEAINMLKSIGWDSAKVKKEGVMWYFLTLCAFHFRVIYGLSLGNLAI